jgi:MarR family transcriptional regulator, organic hydroperoxide resistance regulator
MKKIFNPNEFLKVFKEPDEHPGFMLWQASNIWQRLMRNDLKEYNATYTQFIILCAILYLSKNCTEINQRLIAQHAKLDIMTVSDVLKTLESKKMVVRTINVKDRRHNFLKITGKGAKLVFDIFYKIEKSDKKFFSALKSKENEFNNLLIKLIQGNYDDIYNNDL